MSENDALTRIASQSISSQECLDIQQNTPIGFFKTTSEGKYILVNPALARMHGYEVPYEFMEAINDIYKQVHADPSAREKLENFLNSHDQVIDLECQIVRRDGSNGWVSINLQSVLDQNGSLSHYRGFATDISKYKQAREELLQSRERFSLAMEASRDGLWDWNVQRDEVYYSPSYITMLGYGSEELLSHSSFWKNHIHPEDINEVLRINQACIDNEYDTFQVVFRMKGESSEWRWILGRGKAVARDANGRATRMVGTHTDITDRVKAEEERKRLQKKLFAIQKLESVGLLAGGLAHELNNILMGILGHGEMLLADQSLEDKHKQKTQVMYNAGVRCRDLVQNLLAFSRRQVLKVEPIEINELLSDTLESLQSALRDDIQIRHALCPDTPEIQGDRRQLQQALLYLALDAQDAMPWGGLLTIETDVVDLDEEYASRHVGAVPGSYILLAVSDSGHGMDRETQKHIFEPFFSTKKNGEGKGLSLPTVYGIVKQHQGNIWVYSEPGIGTTFKIYLPLAEKPQEKVQSTRPMISEDIQSPKAVCVVEDNEMVRELVVETMKDQGYKVLCAWNGSQCIEQLEEHTGSLDILLVDVVLPDTNGKALYEQVKQIFPGIRVLYMSGYTEQVITQSGFLEAGSNFIQKPFTLQNLERKMLEVLEGE
jgi:PAS domain S-box-containing protein